MSIKICLFNQLIWKQQSVKCHSQRVQPRCQQPVMYFAKDIRLKLNLNLNHAKSSLLIIYYMVLRKCKIWPDLSLKSFLTVQVYVIN